MPVQAVDIHRSRLAVIYRISRKQLADIRNQQICAAPGIAGDGANLLGDAIAFVKCLTESLLPAGTRKYLLQQIPCRTNTVGIIKGQVQILLVQKRTHMLTGHGRAYSHALMHPLGRIEQKPVRLSIAFQPNEISAADEIPAEVAFAVHSLGKGEGQLLPAADLRGEVQIKGLSLRFQLRIILLAQLHPVHIMDR